MDEAFASCKRDRSEGMGSLLAGQGKVREWLGPQLKERVFELILLRLLIPHREPACAGRERQRSARCLQGSLHKRAGAGRPEYGFAGGSSVANLTEAVLVTSGEEK